MAGRKPKADDLGPSANRVREIRKDRGWSLEQLAQRIGQGWNKDKVSRIERGKGFEVHELPIVAMALGVEPAEILPGGRSQEVLVRFSVGDGGQVAELTGHETMELRPAKLSGVVDPRQATAAIVHNGALAPIIGDGALLIWNVDERVRPDLLQGQLCYIALHDGRMLVRTIVNGERGKYHLLGGGQPLLNVDVSWAAPIRAILPPTAPVIDNGEQGEDDDAPRHYGDWGSPAMHRKRSA